jgi:hypothetical protein
MATPTLDATEFLLGWCDRCNRDVLPYLELDGHDEISHHCLHCDTMLDATLRPSTAAEVEAAGYSVVEARLCGNGGGCSAGCGMRAH